MWLVCFALLAFFSSCGDFINFMLCVFVLFCLFSFVYFVFCSALLAFFSSCGDFINFMLCVFVLFCLFLFMYFVPVVG